MQSLYKEAVESATEGKHCYFEREDDFINLRWYCFEPIALQDNPEYIKALQRRANANEKLETWTSLTSALDDYNALSKLPSTPASLMSSIRQAQRILPIRIEERKATETKEMMDKLKGLGNSFLGAPVFLLMILCGPAYHIARPAAGKFGMSTDNFQFVKNEETGGYSMNFTQNPSKKD